MADEPEAGAGEQSGALDGDGPEGGGEPGGENATVRAAVVTGTLLAVATLLVLYVLVQVWPPPPPPALTTGTTGTSGPSATANTATTSTTTAGAATTTTVVMQAAPNPPVRLFGFRLQPDREARLFMVVALAGALGGLIHALRSLTWYAGNRNLRYSWMMTYYLRPIVGAGLATITYVVLRGGLVLVTTQASPDVVNPFGFAAFGALVGLFSVQASEWLKRVFEQVFVQAPEGQGSGHRGPDRRRPARAGAGRDRGGHHRDRPRRRGHGQLRRGGGVQHAQGLGDRAAGDRSRRRRLRPGHRPHPCRDGPQPQAVHSRTPRRGPGGRATGPPALSRAAYCPMRIGDLHPVSDGTFVARPTYLGSQMPEDAHPELFDRHGTAWLPLGCFLIRSGERVVLVDAGLGPSSRTACTCWSAASSSPVSAPRARPAAGPSRSRTEAVI